MGRSTMSFIKVTLSLAICLILCLTSRTSAKHLLIETVNKASQDDGAKDYHFIGDGHHHEKDYHFVGDGHHHGDYLTRDYESGHKANMTHRIILHTHLILHRQTREDMEGLAE